MFRRINKNLITIASCASAITLYGIYDINRTRLKNEQRTLSLLKLKYLYELNKKEKLKEVDRYIDQDYFDDINSIFKDS